MKKFEEPVLKVKVLTPTVWKKERLEAGATLEIPEDVLDQNPTIFERLPDEPEPKAKEQPAKK